MALEDDALVVDGVRVRLTQAELRLLGCLVHHRDRVVSRDELTRSLWGVTDHDRGRAIDTHMKRLRGKLARVPTVAIATVRMRGFKLVVG